MGAFEKMGAFKIGAFEKSQTWDIWNVGQKGWVGEGILGSPLGPRFFFVFQGAHDATRS